MSISLNAADQRRACASNRELRLAHDLRNVLAVVVAEPVEIDVAVGAVAFHRDEVQRAAKVLGVEARERQAHAARGGRRLDCDGGVLRQDVRAGTPVARLHQPRLVAVGPDVSEARAREAAALVLDFDHHVFWAARDNDAHRRQFGAHRLAVEDGRFACILQRLGENEEDVRRDEREGGL
eukprot:5871919-Pleurochrysis_carterae.AAC.10